MPRFKNGLSRVGEVYHYCFRVNGTQFKGSTRAQDRATAEKVLAQKRKEALLGPENLPQPIPTLGALVDAWVASYKASLPESNSEGACDHYVQYSSRVHLDALGSPEAAGH